MRKLKFRIWYAEENRFLETPDGLFFKYPHSNCGEYVGKFIEKPYDSGEYIGDFITDPYFVNQFTGLFDKNGKEIYDGDICSYIAPKLSFYSGQKDCLISFKDEPSFYGYFISSIKGNFSWTLTREFAKDNIEVIGNVHENPDLLTNA